MNLENIFMKVLYRALLLQATWAEFCQNTSASGQLEKCKTVSQFSGAMLDAFPLARIIMVTIIMI